MQLDLATLPDPTTWVFTGDSITHGVYHTHGMRSWVELVHERIRWELDRLRDIVVNSGVSGWTAGQVVEDYVHLVQRFRPDVVSFSLGTNDSLAGHAGLAPFAAQLRELADRASDDGAVVVLHTPVLTTPDAPAGRRAWLSDYASVVREVAEGRGLALVDHHAVWSEHFGDREPTPWMDDHTHPNAVGHITMAETTLVDLGLGALEGRP